MSGLIGDAMVVAVEIGLICIRFVLVLAAITSPLWIFLWPAS